jgi:hypothetical protein
VPLHGPKGPLDQSGPDPSAILQLIDEPVEVLVNVGRRVTPTRELVTRLSSVRGRDCRPSGLDSPRRHLNGESDLGSHV